MIPAVLDVQSHRGADEWQLDDANVGAGPLWVVANYCRAVRRIARSTEQARRPGARRSRERQTCISTVATITPPVASSMTRDAQ